METPVTVNDRYINSVCKKLGITYKGGKGGDYSFDEVHRMTTQMQIDSGRTKNNVELSICNTAIKNFCNANLP